MSRPREQRKSDQLSEENTSLPRCTGTVQDKETLCKNWDVLFSVATLVQVLGRKAEMMLTRIRAQQGSQPSLVINKGCQDAQSQIPKLRIRQAGIIIAIVVFIL